VIPKDDDTDLALEIKEHIKSDLDSRYQSDEMSSLLDTCAFLDPRFKDKFTMEDDTIMNLMDEIKILNGNETSSTAEQLPEDDPTAPPRKKGKFSEIFGTSSSRANTHGVSIPDQIKHEMDMYLQYPSLDIDESPP